MGYIREYPPQNMATNMVHLRTSIKMDPFLFPLRGASETPFGDNPSFLRETVDTINVFVMNSP